MIGNRMLHMIEEVRKFAIPGSTAHGFQVSDFLALDSFPGPGQYNFQLISETMSDRRCGNGGRSGLARRSVARGARRVGGVEWAAKRDATS